ncbi:ABC transporter ATP-binding protein [Prevotella sp. 10(H)]|uniref:ABC transporter ATP-binding protein n=1 Tax=Prevotella sp. 10(H) TaxID=1158294 RepID=UPI0009DCA603|nr:ABC transporter ATP-binding protein [Prevotella sp. 10(H)]
MEDINSTANIFSQDPEEEKKAEEQNFVEEVQEEAVIAEANVVFNAPKDERYEDVDVINLQHISQVYVGKKTDFVLFEDLNMDIKDFRDQGQFISILGESGCGKSTLLRYISGLQQPTSGKILIYGKEKTEKDTIPMVFQQYSSFPWKTVLDNVALPLRMRGISKEESYERANQMLKTVGLEGHEHKWAKYPLLSGGQLQRVAIARSLIASPQILLMDEPFGALDIATRTSMQNTLLDIYNSAELDPTVIFVTHDINEAVLLSNRIYIMAANPGRVHTIVDIDLPQVRDASLKKTEKLNEYVNYIDGIMTQMSKGD